MDNPETRSAVLTDSEGWETLYQLNFMGYTKTLQIVNYRGVDIYKETTLSKDYKKGVIYSMKTGHPEQPMRFFGSLESVVKKIDFDLGP